MVFLCWLIFWSGADIMYRKVHACFKLVHSLFVKLGLIVKREEEEWDVMGPGGRKCASA